jgi:hypothetical protein
MYDMFYNNRKTVILTIFYDRIPREPEVLAVLYATIHTTLIQKLHSIVSLKSSTSTVLSTESRYETLRSSTSQETFTSF